MSDEKKSKLIERHKAMRIARDEMLRLVWLHLVNVGFNSKGPGHYVRETGTQTEHIGFQKHSSGRDVRVMCHVELNAPAQTVILGPWSDSFARADSPKGIRYHFGWSTKEQDVIRCAGEYSRFINEVILPWFASRSNPQEMA